MKNKLLASLIPGLLVLFCAIAAEAREVYKYRMPDGRILYTTEVSTQGRLLEVLPEPAPAPTVIESERLAKLKREQDKDGRAVGKRLDTLDAVDAEIKAATRALEAAKTAAEAGVEPLAGERLGTRSGRSRLSESYWQRQRELRDALDDARRRLDAAYLARDAIR